MQAKIKRPITLICSNGKRANTTLTGISKDKIGIVFSRPLKVGVRIIVKFTLPIENRVFKMTATAEIAHNHVQTDHYYTILKIIKMPEDCKKLYNRFLYLRSGIANYAA